MAQSLSSLLSEVRREVEEERVRARELEMAAQDKDEMVRIVEKKSNALVGGGIPLRNVYTCTSG